MKRWILSLVAIAALLSTALAPAAAQDAPIAGPVREFTVEDGHFISLSPDGTMYAVAIKNAALCVYDTETLDEISCGSLDELHSGIRLADVVWSPDSTRLAFSENAFVTGYDGDLWMMDAASGDITNITDDGFVGSIFGLNAQDGTFFVDVIPAWTPDSQFITFSRSGWENGERTGNQIAQVPASGGEVEILASVSDDEPGVVYFGAGWAPDGETFYFSLSHVDQDDPDNGIWTYDAASGEVALLASGDDPALGPLTLLRVAASGNRLLAVYPAALGQFSFDGDPYRLVDTATGALSTVPLPETSNSDTSGFTVVTFSPDGTALLSVIARGGVSQLWVTDLASGAQTLVLDELPDTRMDPGLAPSWAANGLVGIGHGVGAGYLTTISGIGLNPVASPIATSVAPDTLASGFPPGTTVLAIGMVPVFAAPDPNGVVVLVLDVDDPVQILAAPVENASGIWYPIVEPESQVIGYAQANRLAALEDVE